MKNKIVYFLILTLTIILPGIFYSQAKEHVVSTKEVFDKSSKDVSIILLDVRTADEFNSETGHIKNAIHIPLQELENRIGELNKYKKNEIIVYCRTGRRSGIATDMLLKKGFDATNMEGGIVKWNNENLPVIKRR